MLSRLAESFQEIRIYQEYKKEINGYINNLFYLLYLCGYREGNSTELTFLSLIGKWKKVLNNEGF